MVKINPQQKSFWTNETTVNLCFPTKKLDEGKSKKICRKKIDPPMTLVLKIQKRDLGNYSNFHSKPAYPSSQPADEKAFTNLRKVGYPGFPLTPNKATRIHLDQQFSVKVIVLF